MALVFGATGGIGSALARRLHALQSSGGSSQAPSAIVLSAEHEDELKGLQQQLNGVDVMPADATDPAAVSAGTGTTGGVDVLTVLSAIGNLLLRG